MKIKPCVFCDNDQYVTVETRQIYSGVHGFETRYYVVCLVCNAGGPEDTTKNRAIKIWNWLWNIINKGEA